MSRNALVVVFLLAAAPAAAQTPVQRGANWPDAAGVVRMVLEGQRDVSVSTSLLTCPRENPYGDSVWVALLAAPAKPQLTFQLATGWAVPLRTCDDRRIEAWYHARLSESTDLLSALPVVDAMLRHGAPRSLAALKALAFDETRDEELRSEILRGLGAERNSRMDLYFEAVAQTSRLPEPYGEREWWALSGSSAAATFLAQAFDVVLAHPGHNAAVLLGGLASQERVHADPALRARLDAVTHTILKAPPQRYPERLRRAAVYGREALERRR